MGGSEGGREGMREGGCCGMDTILVCSYNP